MAIARGAGTEIIRSHHFEYIAANTTAQALIIGVQHHIYTVLSIICCAKAASQNIEVYLTGFDALEGTSAQNINIFKSGSVAQYDTFVWNDKFSFNGCEPVNEGAGVVGAMTTAAEQDAIADQGTATSQTLYMGKDLNGDQFEVFITFIDQNNS